MVSNSFCRILFPSVRCDRRKNVVLIGKLYEKIVCFEYLGLHVVVGGGIDRSLERMK